MLQPCIKRYLRHGTLPQLRVFEASARLGNFTLAAQELHMAQPTASVQIRKLSDMVGLPLFEQVGRRMYLTDAGRHLYDGCHELFRALSSIEAAIDRLRALEAGQLRLAVSATARHFAPRLIGEFIERHPGIRAVMIVHNRATLVARLKDNADDLYLFASPIERDDVVTQALIANPLVVFARDDHPLARVRRIPLERLAREPMLVREAGSGTRALALAHFAARGLAPRIGMELADDEAIREATLAGLGVAIMSRHTLGIEPEPARLIRLDVEGFPLANHWCLAYPTGKQLSVTVRAFLDFSRTEARRIAGVGTGARPQAALLNAS